MKHDRSGRTGRPGLSVLTLAVVIAWSASCAKGGPTTGAPENAAAKAEIGAKTISLHYDGRDILEAG